jgi:hypothetical protein
MSAPVNPLIEIGDLLLDTLQKTAADLDASAAELQATRQLLQAAKQEIETSKRAAVTAGPFKEEDLTKLAFRMEEEGLLCKGDSPEGVVAQISSDPGLLLKLAYSLLTPVTEGQQVRRISKQSSEKVPNVVEFQGRSLVDHDGWLDALG